MTSWRRFPIILLLGTGIMVFAIGCEEEKEEEPRPPPVGHLSLETHTLDFGQSITEQLLNLSNTGDTSLTWSISAASIPYWTDVDPMSGALAADGQVTVTVHVYRVGIGPGTTNARLVFLSDANDDSVTISVQRTCDYLADNFREGSAADWDATLLDKSQHEEGYVVLDPNTENEAGRLMQDVSPTIPTIISARVRRTVQTASDTRYGLLLEGATTADALCFIVYVDDDTNYALKQSVDGQSEILQAGLTSLLSTAGGEWNILRLELYEADQNIYARGYAGTEVLPLFTDIQLDAGLDFVKMGLLSEEYTIHADWFCASRP